MTFLIRGAPASDIRRSWEESRAQFPKGALHMRISDDHDEARAVARYGVNGALAASALMFTLDGVPLIYNGMEVGDATESGDPASSTSSTFSGIRTGPPGFAKHLSRPDSAPPSVPRALQFTGGLAAQF